MLLVSTARHHDLARGAFRTTRMVRFLFEHRSCSWVNQNRRRMLPARQWMLDSVSLLQLNVTDSQLLAVV